MKSSARIGFVVKTFPKLSETFVLGEILGLEKKGMNLAIFSVQRPTDTIHHHEVSLVAAPIQYLGDCKEVAFMSRTLIHLQEAARSPVRYFGSMILALRQEGRKGWPVFARAVTLARAAREMEISHLHAHFANEPASIAACAAHLSGMTYSISAHAKDIYTADRQSLRPKLNNARFVVTCTECNRSHLAGIAGENPNIHRMYHGIDFNRFTPAKAERQETPLILSVGRLREKKGFVTLIQSCALLRDRGVNFRCEIVGYGEDHEKLQRQIDISGLHDRVELVGTMNHDQLIELYSKARLFVLPCQVTANGDRDGIPNVLLEAMAMELPVVTTDVSGIPEVIVDHENGLLVPPQKPAVLADRIEAVIENDSLRQRLGRNGRETVKALFDNEQNLELVFGLLIKAAETVPSNTSMESSKIYVQPAR